MVSEKPLVVFTRKVFFSDNGYFIRIPKQDGDVHKLKDKMIRVELYEVEEETEEKRDDNNGDK